jgi:peptide/nickel transport system ATP-binding protein
VNKVLEFKHVNVSYTKGMFQKKTVEIIPDISFDLHEGEILAIVGESGCGKSTIAKCASGLIEPQNGSVKFNGKDFYQLKKDEYNQLRPKLQMVQQNAYEALNPMKTVYQTLSIPLKHYGVKKRDMKKSILALLERLDIKPADYYIHKYPHNLSGGQRQRLCIARTLIPEPSLIVADEPVSMIDVSMRLAMLDIFIDLNKTKNISFIYITHDLPTVKYLGEFGRVIVMYLGEIVEECSTKEAFKNPFHPYLKALIDAVPEADPRAAKAMGAPRIKDSEAPNITKKPSGCTFHPRCVDAMDICSQFKPESIEISPKHFVACHLAKEKSC